jgi:hypothetical protein
MEERKQNQAVEFSVWESAKLGFGFGLGLAFWELLMIAILFAIFGPLIWGI